MYFDRHDNLDFIFRNQIRTYDSLKKVQSNVDINYN